LIGFAISGTVVGSAIALPISGVLCEEVDWSSIFYIFGIYINYINAESPKEHRFISREEIAYIHETTRKIENKVLFKI